MKLLALLLIPASLAIAQSTPSPAPKIARGTGLPDARTILEKAAQAMGGAESQKSIQTQKLVGRIVFPAAGISGTLLIYRSQRGETYQVMEIPGAGKTESGNNGDVEWERSTLTGPKVRRVASKPGNLLDPDPASFAGAGRFSKMETAGLDNVNGKPCFAVRQWPSEGGAMQTACYDRETFLLVQLQSGAGTMPVKMVFGDYRPVGPVKLPFLTETESRGQTIRVEMDTITLNDPLPPEATALPEEIEKLAYRPQPNEIRELEPDKDRPVLRHRTQSQKKK